MTKNSTQSDHTLDDYADVFKGIGTFPCECSFRIDPSVAPVVCSPKRVQFAFKDRLKTELDSMEKDGIICKVTPTEWVNALVVCKKPNTHKLKACLHPRPLKKKSNNEATLSPTQIGGCDLQASRGKYFSTLDARSGYWAIKVSKESSMLTTFNTAFGRYCFLRLPFGIVSAQDEFQKRVDETYKGLRGVADVVDDIVMFAEQSRSTTPTSEPCSTAPERGIYLYPDKCRICVPEVSYFGHRLTDDSLKPDPLKVKAIRDMPPPTSEAELKTVHGELLGEICTQSSRCVCTTQTTA